MAPRDTPTPDPAPPDPAPPVPAACDLAVWTAAHWPPGARRPPPPGARPPRVVLLDTGLDARLPAFAGARLICRDFAPDAPAGDPTGHGTRSAAMLVGRCPQTGYRGLLPGAELAVARVLTPGDFAATAAAITRALGWAASLGADVVAMPFGSTRPGPAPVARALAALAERGVRLFAAAGNRGPDAECFPARARGVVSVGAAGADGRPLAGCCAGPGVALYAPGADVPALDRHGVGAAHGASPACVIAAALFWEDAPC